MIDLDVFYRPYLEPDDENLLKVGTKLLIALYDVNSKDTDMEAMRLRLSNEFSVLPRQNLFY